MSTSARALSLMRTMTELSGRCPCHSAGYVSTFLNGGALPPVSHSGHVHYPGCGHAMSSTAAESKEYAFEMATSTIRFGPGCTSEVGYDLANIGAKNVLLFTDANLLNLNPVKTAVKSLERAKVKFSVYSDVRVEPTDTSMKEAIAVAKRGNYDAFLAVGGGSVMDTAKAANLYSTFPQAEFLDFVNAPVGKGLPVPGPVKPLIAVPTTSGTGSETTGVAIFDYEPLHAKTGIANRIIRPTLGVVDPLNMATMPKQVAVASGFDVFCHALESFTAIPYNERTPRPAAPQLRPAYQGSNPVSDVWALNAMQIVSKYFFRSVEDPSDEEARSFMALAAAYAGVGFGNAGVHLAHGMSYPIAGLNKTYKHPGYVVNHSIIPHGISVIINAPAVFQYTAPTNPERHLQAAGILGANVSNAKSSDAGKILSDVILKYMHRLEVPDGLKALGYSSSDIPKLVEGTLPQKRVLAVAPKSTGAEDLYSLFEKTLRCYV